MTYPYPAVEIIELTRIYLAVFYSLVAAFYTVRIVFMVKACQQVVFAGERCSDTWWNHRAFQVFRAAIWLVCVLRLICPSTDNFLGVMPGLLQPWVIILGNGLLTVGFLLTLVTNMRFKADWRSGIDPSGPSHMITTGFYRYSRNPMFVCIAVAQLGFFLALPSLFSLLCLLVGVHTLRRQALAEEKHLAELFPNVYANYSQHVRRWV